MYIVLWGYLGNDAEDSLDKIPILDTEDLVVKFVSLDTLISNNIYPENMIIPSGRVYINAIMTLLPGGVSYGVFKFYLWYMTINSSTFYVRVVRNKYFAEIYLVEGNISTLKLGIARGNIRLSGRGKTDTCTLLYPFRVGNYLVVRFWFACNYDIFITLVFSLNGEFVGEIIESKRPVVFKIENHIEVSSLLVAKLGMLGY